MENLDSTQFNISSGLLKAYQGKDGRKRLKTIASSTIVDRTGDEMTENAIRKMAESAKQNMTIFLNHSYRVPEDVFGSVEDVAVVRQGEVWDLEFDVRLNEANDRALKTFEAIENGTKLGTSIGARINEGGAKKNDNGGYTFDDVSLLEASIVALPSNPRSWVERVMKAYRETTEDEDEVTVFGDRDGTFLSKVETEVPVQKDNDPDPEPEPEPDPPELTKDADEPEPDAPAEPSEPDTADEAPEELTESETPITAQDGQLTEPEAAGGEVPSPEAVLAAEEISLPTTDLGSLFDVLKTTTSELVDLRKQLAEQAEHRVRAETERDSAIADLRKAQAIIEQVASLPIGRRHGFDDSVREFRSKFSDLYSDDFLKMLETTE